MAVSRRLLARVAGQGVIIEDDDTVMEAKMAAKPVQRPSRRHGTAGPRRSVLVQMGDPILCDPNPLLNNQLLSYGAARGPRPGDHADAIPRPNGCGSNRRGAL